MQIFLENDAVFAVQVNTIESKKVSTKFHGNPSGGCQDVSLWATVLDQRTDGPTKAVISRATLLAWLKISPMGSQTAQLWSKSMPGLTERQTEEEKENN